MQKSVVEWLDRTAGIFPEKVAAIDENGKITFEEYRRKSTGIGQTIINSVDGMHKPIVVYLNKSFKVLVSFLGVAYSGNFYSPIDIDMPEQRVNKILEILNPALVITTIELKDKFERFNYDGKYLIYDEVEPLKGSTAVNERMEHVVDMDLLYVLFTSGSTGIPKGVCITHRGVIDYIDCVTSIFHVTEKDSFGNQAPFYFDNSILDIYSSMKSGATLYIIPQNLFSQPVKLLQYLFENSINTIFWVPSALIVVSKLKAFRNVNINGILKRVLFCGEVMPNKQLNIWRTYLPDVLYANLYGPTEITDACTYYIIERDFSDEEPLPIGKPMKNTEIIVFDEHDKQVIEKNRIGELCVRGTGVAMGYYNNPEKTREVFVQNPLNLAFEEKIYRTGDLVYYNDYDELVYISRKDFQIKHMGHRIELGEIETAVSSFPEISVCCCLYDSKRSRIVLFIDYDLPKEIVRERLERMLPEYMIPDKIICKDCIPLNINGKIDRGQLKELL